MGTVDVMNGLVGLVGLVGVCLYCERARCSGVYYECVPPR